MYRGGFIGILIMIVLVGVGIVMLIHPTPPTWADNPELNGMLRALWSSTGGMLAIVAGLIVGSLSIRSGE